MNILRFLSDDKKKEQERKNRIQHPHLIESRKHWDEMEPWMNLGDLLTHFGVEE